MAERITEVRLDIEELNSLLAHATRQKVKDLLILEIRRLQTELINAQKLIDSSKSYDSNGTSKLSSQTNSNKCYDVKLNNYAWDQTPDFVKIYVTLNKVQTLPADAVFCNFQERSIDLHVLGLESKNYILPINNLAEAIDTDKSHVKVKSDMLICYLAKKTRGNNWPCVTSVEKRIKDAKSTTPMPEPGEDPSASLMTMMKKMYDEGDDDLKRTIAKAWTEGQEKRDRGEMPGM